MSSQVLKKGYIKKKKERLFSWCIFYFYILVQCKYIEEIVILLFHLVEKMVLNGV